MVENGGSSQQAPPPPGRRRPPATIDLEASEIPAEPSSSDKQDSQARARGLFAMRPWMLIAACATGVAIAALAFWGTMAIREPASRGTDTATTELAAKLAMLESQVNNLAGRPGSTDAKAMAEFNTRTGSIETAQQSLQASFDDLRRRFDELNAARTPSNPADRQDIDTLTARVAADEQIVQGIEKWLANMPEASGADRALRLALIAATLRFAIERGDPFATEFAVAQSLIADQSALVPLEPYAEIGVPSAAALGRDFSKFAPTLMNAARGPSPDGSLLDRLQANAARLIRIRPVEEATGDDPVTVVSRAEFKASRNDIPGVIAELDKLNPTMRAPADAWIKAATGRTAAVNAARQLAARALDALGQPAQ